jgi:DNA polymerase elongation subunit (family B)
MTREQEDMIIARAQDILERRMAVVKEVQIDLRKVLHYGAYYMGAIQAVQEVTRQLLEGDKPKKDDWIYLEAFWKFITKSKRNMQLFMDGTEIRYRNHVRDKKGKLKSVECYFVERRTLLTEKT